MHKYTITGASAGRKVHVTITGDDSLAKELWSFLAGEMIASRSIGAYNSVQSVVERIEEPPTLRVVVMTDQLPDFQVGDVFTVQGEARNGEYWYVYNGTDELELLPKAACIVVTEPKDMWIEELTQMTPQDWMVLDEMVHGTHFQDDAEDDDERDIQDE